MGVDVRRLCPVRWIRAASVLPGVLRRFLRRPALRHERRVTDDRARAGASGFSQLVQAALPVRLCDVPMRGGRVTPSTRAHADEAAVTAAFAADLAEALCREPRQIPSKYLYDELGSALFEAICRLPWYRITRAESSLLVRHARDIFRPLARPIGLAELGCGSGDKLALLVSAAGERF